MLNQNIFKKVAISIALASSLVSSLSASNNFPPSIPSGSDLHENTTKARQFKRSTKIEISNNWQLIGFTTKTKNYLKWDELLTTQNVNKGECVIIYSFENEVFQGSKYCNWSGYDIDREYLNNVASIDNNIKYGDGFWIKSTNASLDITIPSDELGEGYFRLIPPGYTNDDLPSTGNSEEFIKIKNNKFQIVGFSYEEKVTWNSLLSSKLQNGECLEVFAFEKNEYTYSKFCFEKNGAKEEGLKEEGLNQLPRINQEIKVGKGFWVKSNFDLNF